MLPEYDDDDKRKMERLLYKSHLSNGCGLSEKDVEYLQRKQRVNFESYAIFTERYRAKKFSKVKPKKIFILNKNRFKIGCSFFLMAYGLWINNDTLSILGMMVLYLGMLLPPLEEINKKVDKLLKEKEN